MGVFWYFSGWDVKKINGSLSSRGWLYSFMSMLYQPLVLALFGVNPPRRSFSLGRRQLHVLNVNVHGLNSLTLRIWTLPPVFNEWRIPWHLAFSSWKYAGRAFCRWTGTVYLLSCSISTKTKTAQQHNPRLESRWLRRPLRAKSIAIRRVRLCPRNAPFFHGNYR